MAAVADAPDPEPAERKRLQSVLSFCGARRPAAAVLRLRVSEAWLTVRMRCRSMYATGGPLVALRDKVGVRAWLGSATATPEATDEVRASGTGREAPLQPPSLDAARDHVSMLARLPARRAFCESSSHLSLGPLPQLVDSIADHVDKKEFLEHLSASCAAQHGANQGALSGEH